MYFFDIEVKEVSGDPADPAEFQSFFFGRFHGNSISWVLKNHGLFMFLPDFPNEFQRPVAFFVNPRTVGKALRWEAMMSHWPVAHCGDRRGPRPVALVNRWCMV